RKALGEEVAARLETRAPGYVLRVGAGETDVLDLINRRERARALIEAGEAARASAELDAALSMCRDEPLFDVPSATLREVEVYRWQELRVQTLKWYIDIDLSLHRDAELLPKLWRLVAENPLRETFVAQLMLALSRTGQQREALELFIRVRAALVDQAGTEPGTEVRGDARPYPGRHRAAAHRSIAQTSVGQTICGEVEIRPPGRGPVRPLPRPGRRARTPPPRPAPGPAPARGGGDSPPARAPPAVGETPDPPGPTPRRRPGLHRPRGTRARPHPRTDHRVAHQS